ncbi:MAG: hypothetical protein ACODAJ_16690 [Planctomycetota bacterium]
MYQRNASRPSFTDGRAVALAVTVLTMLLGHVSAQAQAPRRDAPGQRKAALQVGTYDPQAVFMKHPAQEQLAKAGQAARTQMQKAQQEGDQEKVEQVQRQYAETRTRFIDKFEDDVADALPDVARAAGVKVIAVQVAYTAEDVRTKDITPHLVKVFSKQDEGKRERPTLPRVPDRQR